MIYTLTLNPALDYVVRVDAFQEGVLNRANCCDIQFGGKGINVSTVLHNLGIPSTALGFTAGFTGSALEEALTHMGIGTDFVRLESGLTRINIKLKSGVESEINAPGPEIRDVDQEKLFRKLDQLQDGDFLVLAGSIPPSLPTDFYRQILAALSGRNIHAVVDTGASALRSTLPCRPFLIKPNLTELCDLAGRTLTEEAKITACAADLQQSGARNVLVSMAERGSLLLDETGKIHRLDAHRGTVRNSVGAGDSMVAGFLAGWIRTGRYDMAHRLGCAAGAATAFSDGLADRQQILTIYSQEDDPT